MQGKYITDTSQNVQAVGRNSFMKKTDCITPEKNMSER